MAKHIPVPKNPTVKSLNDSLDAIFQCITDLNSELPVGAIVGWPTPNVPAGRFMMCDGRELNRNEYADLFGIVGTKYGAGNGISTFNVPDRRGVFGRGNIDLTPVLGSGSAVNNAVTFTNHKFNRTGFKVRLTSGALTGIVAAVTYYVIIIDSNTISLASTYNNAMSRTAISVSGSNTAVLTQYEAPDAAIRQPAIPSNPTSGVGTREESAMQLLNGRMNSITGRSSLGPTGPFYKLNQSAVQGYTGPNYDSSNVIFDNSRVARTSDETRPSNLTANYIIKY